MKRILALDCNDKVGETVTLMGWVNTIRTHGSVNFIDLRDRSGIIQVVGDKTLKKAHLEDVVQITGEVTKRSQETINDKIPTGSIEINIESFTVLNPSTPPPFPIDTDGKEIDEEIRLKYRYLDLRRPRLQKHLQTRSTYVQALREYLFKQDFTEIETPMLTKSTPEGSRDFVVPSRLYPGKFYALPQSPQQYKQLLMTAGFENYFQIARCLRDEDPRADRAYEHSQLDLEMSFVDREQVMDLVEGAIIHAVEAIEGKIVKKPFPVIPYQEAIKKYGGDKFDLRTDQQKEDGELAFAWVVDFPFFEKTPDGDWTFTHNPFSSPIPDHQDWLVKKENIDQIVTNQYDLVCNGFEIAGGSIRAHTPKMLQSVFEIMGYSKDQIQEQFGHMLDAFSYGTPPHGGCAHGFERLLMALFNETSIHEVQAFPQTGRGRTSIMDAPSPLSKEQLAELGLNSLNKEYDSAYDHILDLLKNHKVEHELLEHEPVLTSQDAVKVRGDVSLHQGAKALILQADKDLILYVVPGDQRADLDKLKQFLKVKRVAFASKDTVSKKTGLEVGSIPPLGSTIGLQTYLDPALSDNKEIAFNAGRTDRSIRMRYTDYLKIEKPILVED